MTGATIPELEPEASRVRVEKVVTSGVFSLDGQDFDVDNNVWVVGDDQECVVVDAAHDADAIASVVGDRRCVAVVCTHGHNDHVNAAVELAGAVRGPVLLADADRMLWDTVHPDRAPDGSLTEGQQLSVAGVTLQVMATPGHSPGGVCLYAPTLEVLFSGDTLFRGGPGATGRSYSDFPTIVTSIRERLLTLPPDTVVHTGHGEDTSVAAETPDVEEWLARGH